MSKFKVGDKVKVVRGSFLSQFIEHFSCGYGIVKGESRYRDNTWVIVTSPNGYGDSYREEDLELFDKPMVLEVLNKECLKILNLQIYYNDNDKKFKVNNSLNDLRKFFSEKSARLMNKGEGIGIDELAQYTLVVKEEPLKLPTHITLQDLIDRNACTEGKDFFIECILGTKVPYATVSNSLNIRTINFLKELTIEGKYEWYQWIVNKFGLPIFRFSDKNICTGSLEHLRELKRLYKEQEKQ